MNADPREAAVLVGSCLCGGIRLTARRVSGLLLYCHCRPCRKSAGAPFNAVITVASDGFELMDPEGLLREFRSSPSKLRCFCSRCGAQILSRREGSDEVRVRAGILDNLEDVKSAGHIYFADAVPWFEAGDELPRYDALEPGRVSAHD